MAGGPGFCKKAQWISPQAHRHHQGSGQHPSTASAPAPASKFAPSVFFALAFSVDCDSGCISQGNLFPPQVGFSSWIFITAVEKQDHVPVWGSDDNLGCESPCLPPHLRENLLYPTLCAKLTGPGAFEGSSHFPSPHQSPWITDAHCPMSFR